MQIINNAESAWDKLRVFGLHSKGNFLGFNRYSGSNGCVTRIDVATGMRVMLIPASVPRSERVLRSDKPKGKRGRPCIVGCIMFREPGKVGRPAIQGPKEQLVFAGPHQKRGRKPFIGPKMQAATAQTATDTTQAPKKRGRKSEADRLKEAKPGDIVAVKGGYWTMLACGIPTWTS